MSADLKEGVGSADTVGEEIDHGRRLFIKGMGGAAVGLAVSGFAGAVFAGEKSEAAEVTKEESEQAELARFAQRVNEEWKRRREEFHFFSKAEQQDTPLAPEILKILQSLMYDAPDSLKSIITDAITAQMPIADFMRVLLKKGYLLNTAEMYNNTEPGNILAPASTRMATTGELSTLSSIFPGEVNSKIELVEVDGELQTGEYGVTTFGIPVIDTKNTQEHSRNIALCTPSYWKGLDDSVGLVAINELFHAEFYRRYREFLMDQGASHPIKLKYDEDPVSIASNKLEELFSDAASYLAYPREKFLEFLFGAFFTAHTQANSQGEIDVMVGTSIEGYTYSIKHFISKYTKLMNEAELSKLEVALLKAQEVHLQNAEFFEMHKNNEPMIKIINQQILEDIAVIVKQFLEKNHEFASQNAVLTVSSNYLHFSKSLIEYIDTEKNLWEEERNKKDINPKQPNPFQPKKEYQAHVFELQPNPQS